MAFHWVSFRRNSKEKKNLIGLDLSHKDDSAQWKKRLASPGRSEYTIEFKHTGIFFFISILTQLLFLFIHTYE